MVIGEDYHAIADHAYVWQIDERLYSEFELVTIKKELPSASLFRSLHFDEREKDKTQYCIW